MDTKELRALYDKHVPDGNIMKMSANEDDIDEFFRAQLTGFLLKYGPVLMLLARDKERVCSIRNRNDC